VAAPLPCPPDEALAAFAAGTLEVGARDALELHLDACAICRDVLAAIVAEGERPLPLTATPEDAGLPCRPLAPGERLLRYEVLRPLGLGAAGVVYEAFDPQLERRVALKVVSAGSRREVRDRVLEEARVMARLADPHVVAVHDAFELEGLLVMVLELVEGESLADWLYARPRGWREIVTTFLGAGAGLRAAHEAGVVHGDFKPENVLVARDGRARVTDFGLGHLVRAAERGVPDAGTSGPAGTPLYMAPEGLHGAAPDARSDQYSFCVALHEALLGSFPGGERALPAPAPSPPLPARRPAPPAWLRRVLARGLAATPDARYPAMKDLLRALDQGLRRRARVSVALASLGLLLTLGAIEAVRYRAAADARPLEPPRRDAWTCALTDAPPPVGVDVRLVQFFCVDRHTVPAPWAEAQRTCAASGGELLSCSSDRDCRRTEGVVPEGAAHWIGARDRRERDGPTEVVWGDGQPVLSHLLARRLPDPPPAAPGCLSLSGEAPREGARLWVRRDCAEALPYVCQRAAWAVLGKTSQAYFVHPRPQYWDDARDTCARLGGHLATLTSADELAFVLNRAMIPGLYGETNFWLGATDRAQEGRFAWITGEPFAFQAFHPGEPDNLDGLQHCLVLNTSTQRWHDRHCETRYPFVCEGKASSPPAP
jgi:hypothetical protein